MIKFDYIATVGVVLTISRLNCQNSTYRNSEMILLPEDVVHFIEEDGVTMTVREATQKEINAEYGMRSHRAERNGPSELKRV